MTYILGFLFVSILGTIGHYLYDKTNKNKLIGYLFATDESLYSHMKLGFTPLLLWMFVEKCKIINNENIIAVVGISMLVFAVTISFSYILTTTIIRKGSPIINISSFYIGVLLSFIAQFLLINSISLSFYIKIVGNITFILILLSYIFQNKMSVIKRS